MWDALDATTLAWAGAAGLAIGLALAWLHRRGTLGRLATLLLAPPLILAPLAWALADATGATDWLEGLRCAAALIIPLSAASWLAARVAGLDITPEEKRAMSLVSNLDLEARQRWAAENILNSEALTDDLADPEAARLLAWATEQAERLARETAPLPPEEAQTVLEERLSALRKLVRGANKLAGEPQPADPDRLHSRLARLTAAAQQIGLAPPGEEALAAYVAEQEEWGADTRLARLLDLWGEPATETQAPHASEEAS